MNIGNGIIIKYLIVETTKSTHIISFNENNKITEWTRSKYIGWWLNEN